MTIAVSYVADALIPLASYILLNNVLTALWVSVGVTLMALFLSGYVKVRFAGIAALRSGLQTMLIGGLAAGAAFTIARLIS